MVSSANGVGSDGSGPVVNLVVRPWKTPSGDKVQLSGTFLPQPDTLLSFESLLRPDKRAELFASLLEVEPKLSSVKIGYSYIFILENVGTPEEPKWDPFLESCSSDLIDEQIKSLSTDSPENEFVGKLIIWAVAEAGNTGEDSLVELEFDFNGNEKIENTAADIFMDNLIDKIPGLDKTKISRIVRENKKEDS